MPGAYQYLNTYAVGEVLAALSTLRPPSGQIFLLRWNCYSALACTVCPLNVCPLFIRLHHRRYFLDYAENEGLASTLCSYHKNFIGAIDSCIIPPAAFAVTTSTICDGNINTFRHLSEKHQVPSFLIDVPQYNTPDAKAYVTEQLKELIAMLEDTFHQKFQEEELVPILQRENASKACYERCLKNLRTHHYPSS